MPLIILLFSRIDLYVNTSCTTPLNNLSEIIKLCSTSSRHSFGQTKPAQAPGAVPPRASITHTGKPSNTSVDQIERFYARNLPLSREMAINLQSFGGGDHA